MSAKKVTLSSSLAAWRDRGPRSGETPVRFPALLRGHEADCRLLQELTRRSSRCEVMKGGTARRWSFPLLRTEG